MKKTYLFMLCTGLVLAGCTSKEQDEKIKNFWAQQFLGAMMQMSVKNPAVLQKAMPLAMAKSASARPQKQMPSFAEYPTLPISVGNPDETVAAQPSSVKSASRNAPQVLDVTMEDDALPGKAPYAERMRMTQAWSEVQENNQTLLKDLQSTFGEEVKNSAFYITLNTERKLKKEAAAALNYKAYLTKQQQILAEQDQAIKQLMQQNKKSLRRIRKSPAAN